VGARLALRNGSDIEGIHLTPRGSFIDITREDGSSLFIPAERVMFGENTHAQAGEQTKAATAPVSGTNGPTRSGNPPNDKVSASIGDKSSDTPNPEHITTTKEKVRTYLTAHGLDEDTYTLRHIPGKTRWYVTPAEGIDDHTRGKVRKATETQRYPFKHDPVEDARYIEYADIPKLGTHAGQLAGGTA